MYCKEMGEKDRHGMRKYPQSRKSHELRNKLRQPRASWPHGQGFRSSDVREASPATAAIAGHILAVRVPRWQGRPHGTHRVAARALEAHQRPLHSCCHFLRWCATALAARHRGERGSSGWRGYCNCAAPMTCLWTTAGEIGWSHSCWGGGNRTVMGESTALMCREGGGALGQRQRCICRAVTWGHG